MANRIVRIGLIGMGGVLVLLGLGAVGTYAWARQAAMGKLSAARAVHDRAFPIPFPLSADEASKVAANGGDPVKVALEAARARGKHLLESRYACQECHGHDLGGGKMIDDVAIGKVMGPNLTSGRGGRTAGYGARDWDRIVRHGLKRDGTPTLMPSQDFARMSDQELSDIVTYIRGVPAVDRDIPPPEMGPMGTLLIATGRIRLSADVIRDHQAAHGELPPIDAATAELGAHLAATCTGCHGPNLSGGPIAGGDPAWPPASNLTPHPTGLASWTEEDFVRCLKTGLRKDGTPLRDPMSKTVPWTARMTDAERKALWLHVRSVPASPTGTRS